MTLKRSDAVKFVLPKTFYDKFEAPYAEWNEHMELVFDNCDLNLEMAIILRESAANDLIYTVEEVDNDGDIRLKEIPYTWPPELVHKKLKIITEKENINEQKRNV